QAAVGLPASDPLRIGLQRLLAEAIAAQGDRPRARAMLEALYAESRRLRGGQDEESLATGNSLAILMTRMGESKAGRELLEQLATQRIAAQGESHPDTLGLLHNLAIARVLTGDAKGAVELQRRLVE